MIVLYTRLPRTYVYLDRSTDVTTFGSKRVNAVHRKHPELDHASNWLSCCFYLELFLVSSSSCPVFLFHMRKFKKKTDNNTNKYLTKVLHSQFCIRLLFYLQNLHIFVAKLTKAGNKSW